MKYGYDAAKLLSEHGIDEVYTTCPCCYISDVTLWLETFYGFCQPRFPRSLKCGNCGAQFRFTLMAEEQSDGFIHYEIDC